MTINHAHASPAAPHIPGLRMLREIGQGGMSVIWLAEEPELRRQVAVKVMLPEALADEVSKRRFENEARMLAKLDHPGIVRIYQVGRTAEGLPWYSMPYLAHGHLAQRDWRGDEAGVRRTLDALLLALGSAHDQGVIHRDIKAENVLFDDAGRPLLADFGIALRRGYGPRVTGVGFAVGSTAYMPPEQAKGQQVDRRADLYSIGVLAWEMLNGKLPFAGSDALAMALMHVQQPVPRLPRQLRHWQKFFDTALAKEPIHRFQDAAQMREALAAIRIPTRLRKLRADAPIANASPAATVATPARARVRTWAALALGGAVMAALTLLWWRWPVGADNERRTAGPAPEHAVDSASEPVFATATSRADPPLADDAMLRPVPTHPGERRIDAAQRQLKAGRLHAPSGDNVLDSLLSAAREQPPHPDIGGIALSAYTLSAQRVAQAISEGDAALAHQMTPVLASFARLAGPAADSERRRHVRHIGGLLEKHIEAADSRAIAVAWVELGGEAGVDSDTLQRLRARANRILEAGDPLPGQFDGARLVKAGTGLVGIPARAVSHADYARFVEATQRTETTCSQRGSRIQRAGRRDSRPGASKDPQMPVTCVSWQDAAAYAQWLTHRTRQQYRLPLQAEAAHLPDIGGERALALWLHDCGPDCSQRRITGHGWRNADAHVLDNRRGYDDVGVLLVRDP